MRKIPIFYHVPKNAGTYIIGCYSRLMHYWKNFEMRKDLETCYEEAKHVMIMKNGLIVARLFLLYSDNFLIREHDNITIISEFQIEIDFKNFTKDFLQETFVFGFVIESNGFKYRNAFLDVLKNLYQFHEFIILRETLSRAISMFSYNSSNFSEHDYGHNTITAKTFEDYICSDQFEYCWLIKNILGVEDECVIKQAHFNLALKILKTIKTYDISNVDSAIQDAFMRCYKFNIMQSDIEFDLIFKNSTPRKQISYKNLSITAKKRFLEITRWDRKLYSALLKYK